MFYLEVTLSRLEAPLEDVALAGGVSLDAASARGTTHISISGSPTATTTATTVFLTTKPQTVRIPIPTSEIEQTQGDQFKMKDSSRLLFTSERVAASVLGTVCTTMSGQGSVHLDELLASDKLAVGAVGLKYPNWEELSAAIGVRDPRVIHVGEKEGEIKVHFDKDTKFDTAQTDALADLEALFAEAWSLRESVVYTKAPTLTKSVMRTPVGINGSGYDIAAAVVAKPFSHSTEALEDLLKSAIMTELGGSQGDMSMFLSENLTSVDRARWAGVVASSLSTAAASVIPYRADGRTVLLPNNELKHYSTESWMAEPVRPFGADDCDGSAAWVTSAVSHVGNVMLSDIDAKNKFPTLYGVHRSLAHYKVGIAILGAKAVSADAVGGETSGIAGHAQVLLLPKVHVLDALHRGTASNIRKKDGDGVASEVPVLSPSHDRDEVANFRFRAEYKQTEVINSPFPVADVRALSNTFNQCEILQDLRQLPGLATEGTGAANSTLWVEDANERHNKMEAVARSEVTFAQLTPSQAVPIKDLDAGQGETHMFYDSFVEIVFPVSDLDTSLAQKGLASSHYVFCKTANVITESGVTPRQIATGDYSLLPLWQADTTRATLLLDAFTETQRQTLPRSKAPELSDSQKISLDESMSFLSTLQTELAGRPPPSKAVEVRFTFTFASLVSNPAGIANVADLASSIHGAAGAVDVMPVRELAKYKGVDVGVSVVVTLLTRS